MSSHSSAFVCFNQAVWFGLMFSFCTHLLSLFSYPPNSKREVKGIAHRGNSPSSFCILSLYLGEHCSQKKTQEYCLYFEDICSKMAYRKEKKKIGSIIIRLMGIFDSLRVNLAQSVCWLRLLDLLIVTHRYLHMPSLLQRPFSCISACDCSIHCTPVPHTHSHDLLILMPFHTSARFLLNEDKVH